MQVNVKYMNSLKNQNMWSQNLEVKIEKITLGSSPFLCDNWCKILKHSTNFPAWKSKAASLAKPATTVRVLSSSAVAAASGDPSLVASGNDEDAESIGADRLEWVKTSLRKQSSEC